MEGDVTQKVLLKLYNKIQKKMKVSWKTIRFFSYKIFFGNIWII